MLTESNAKEFARDWIAAWNSHSLERILAHYSPDVVLTSPVAARILNDASGTVRGSAALRSYFHKGLETYPDLHFELVDVMFGLSSAVLCYVNQRKAKTAEFMEFDEQGRVVRVVANYSA